MKNYLARYTIYSAEDKWQKKAGIYEFMSDKNKFYNSWHPRFEELKKFKAEDDNSAKEKADYLRELLIDDLTKSYVIDITIDELLETRKIDVNDIKRRDSNKIIPKEKLGLSNLIK